MGKIKRRGYNVQHSPSVGNIEIETMENYQGAMGLSIEKLSHN